MVKVTGRTHRQRMAVQAIEALGGSVMYDFEIQGKAEPPGPRWLRSMVGDEYFMNVEEVLLWDASADDRVVSQLCNLKHVKKMYLQGTQISDASVPYLEAMHELEILSLWKTRVSEDAKARIRRKLPGCQVL